jgi:hypothetical protein
VCHRPRKSEAGNDVGNARGAHGFVDHRVTAAESSLVVRFGAQAGEPKEPVHTGGLRGSYGVQAERFHILNVMTDDPAEAEEMRRQMLDVESVTDVMMLGLSGWVDSDQERPA